jgi:hypothetical protein
VLIGATSNTEIFLGIAAAASLVIGFVAVIGLAVFVLRKAPRDGSDIGRDPRLDVDEQEHRNGSGSRPRRP